MASPLYRKKGRLLLIVLGCLGVVGCNGTRSEQDHPAPEPVANDVAVELTDVTREAGLGAFRHETGAFGKKWMPETMAGGGGFIDYNGDGWMDIVLVGGGSWPGYGEEEVPALWLYRNDGDSGSSPGQAPTFTNATEEAGLGGVRTYGVGIAAADYDNDGDEDFFLTTTSENMLFRNEGGVFAEMGKEAGLAEQAEWSSATLFFDADRDGDLDLYVGNYVDWSPEKDVWCSFDGKVKSYCTPEVYEGEPSRFYRNNGDGTFTEATRQAGFWPNAGKALGVAEEDVNRDGWPDLVVASDLERDLLYENDGDGTFTEKGLASGIAFDETGKARAGMGVDTGVVDSTGEVSIFVGNFSHEMIGVFRHAGRGLFTDRAAASKIGRPSLLTLTFGLFLFDVDLDGDLDLFAANGHVQEEVDHVQESVTYRQRPQLFLNQGDGTFELSPAEGPLARPLTARGAAYADYDRDGDLDILITENGGGAYLWRNDRSHGSFLRVRLTGEKSNREGIGARIVTVADGRRMERRIRTGSSYLSQSEKVATFGLGNATAVDSLLVYWPSGRVSRFGEIAANRDLRVIEGGRIVEVEASTSPAPAVANR